MYTASASLNDRFAIYGTNQVEVIELSHKLKLPVDDILNAVQEVGFDEEEIEEYIRDRYNRY